MSCPKEHVWQEPVRYAGSISFDPPPGSVHYSAVVYVCKNCLAQRVEKMSAEQAETMRDGLPGVVYMSVDQTRLAAGQKACEGDE